MMKIVQKSKGPKYQDVFWYDGLIARCGKYRIIATGEVTVQFVSDENWVHDATAKREARRRGITDKDIPNLKFQHNSWFEMSYDGEDDPAQCTWDDYGEAMAAFRLVVEEGDYRPSKVR